MIETGATFGAMLLFVVAGLCAGIIKDILGIFNLIAKKQLLVKIISDFIFGLLAGIIFIYCIFEFELGEFAFFEVLSFVIGIVFEQIFIKNMFAIPLKWVYNKITFKLKESKKAKITH